MCLHGDIAFDYVGVYVWVFLHCTQIMESCDCGEILTECFSNIIIDVVIIIIVNLYYLSIKCYMFIT